MKKEDILERSRKDYKENDEREKQELLKAGYLGGAVAAAISLAFGLIVSLSGGSIYPFLVITFSYLATMSFFSYYKLDKKKVYLLQAICWTLTALIYTIMFFNGN